MNKLTKQIVLVVVSFIILFSIPIYSIIVHNDVLKNGEEFLFKVETYDPYDMFRGNYLNIRFQEDSVRKEYEDSIYNDSGFEAYFTIKEDGDGFAYFDNMSTTKPKDTTDYFKGFYHEYANQIKTPTRYYMNENKSFNAEDIYFENIDNTYVKVRVKNGKMVIVGIYVNGELIDSIV